MIFFFQLAIFYDWLFYKEKYDSVMNIGTQFTCFTGTKYKYWYNAQILTLLLLLLKPAALLIWNKSTNTDAAAAAARARRAAHLEVHTQVD